LCISTLLLMVVAESVADLVDNAAKIVLGVAPPQIEVSDAVAHATNVAGASIVDSDVNDMSGVRRCALFDQHVAGVAMPIRHCITEDFLSCRVDV